MKLSLLLQLLQFLHMIFFFLSLFSLSLFTSFRASIFSSTHQFSRHHDKKIETKQLIFFAFACCFTTPWRCIGGVSNGAVEDLNWSGFFFFFFSSIVITCPSPLLDLTVSQVALVHFPFLSVVGLAFQLAF